MRAILSAVRTAVLRYHARHRDVDAALAPYKQVPQQREGEKAAGGRAITAETVRP